jgi:hypothetical protein
MNIHNASFSFEKVDPLMGGTRKPEYRKKFPTSLGTFFFAINLLRLVHYYFIEIGMFQFQVLKTKIFVSQKALQSCSTCVKSINGIVGGRMAAMTCQ